MTPGDTPRLILISQWPKVKNAEFELIEKIRQTGYEITVVDFLGCDVATGKNINDATLAGRYDFALSFHYETPKFLNLPTFLWVANPLEYMHLREDYRHTIIHNCRAYDDYLYNGSDLLKGHINLVVGKEWHDSGLYFYASCSRNSLQSPDTLSTDALRAGLIFYCGINWERGLDKSGRAQGLLETLQKSGSVDFYGPRQLGGIDPWKGFASYRGEIPFDGTSLPRAMRGYSAVLAISSPAHLKSQTSSSRVFEGLAAGVPVISDNNPHVRKLFGDLVYYFDGATERERAESILNARDRILSAPREARERVTEAQTLIGEKYCFEVSLPHAAEAVRRSHIGQHFTDCSQGKALPRIDIVLFHHDPYAQSAEGFPNLPHILTALASLRGKAAVRILLGEKCVLDLPETEGVEWINPSNDENLTANWPRLRLGEKVAHLAPLISADIAVFLTQEDFPHHDYFTAFLDWHECEDNRNTLYLSGFFINDLAMPAPASASEITRSNSSRGLHRWTRKSISEHQLGQFWLTDTLLNSMDLTRISNFDVLFPVALYLESLNAGISVHRSRHVTLRVSRDYFSSHLEAFSQSAGKGFWAQHYDLPSNYQHELNGLYDAFHECSEAVQIIDVIAGHDQLSPTLIDPALLKLLNQLSHKIKPIYRVWRRIRNSCANLSK